MIDTMTIIIVTDVRQSRFEIRSGPALRLGKAEKEKNLHRFTALERAGGRLSSLPLDDASSDAAYTANTNTASTCRIVAMRFAYAMISLEIPEARAAY